jgi:hypothetical protein
LNLFLQSVLASLVLHLWNRKAAENLATCQNKFCLLPNCWKWGNGGSLCQPISI